MDELSRRNGYTGFAAERAEKARAIARGREAHARFVLIAGERALIAIGKETFRALHAREEALALGGEPQAAVFLGEDEAGPLYAAPAPLPAEDTGPAIKAIDLRSIAVQGLLAPAELALTGAAKALCGWHARHGYCANCGAATLPANGGWRRDCAGCGAQHFPRVDPVAIMLAVDGGRVLLARSPHFQPGLYSALAGFVEPGETIEEAVRRELYEEAGIRTGQVRYHSSQPWPFPSSLMIGCFARALSTDIVPDADEIEDARWFTRAEVAAMLEGRDPAGRAVPPPTAIAHQLLKSFAGGEAILPD